MREIKFRVWNNNGKFMFDSFHYKTASSDYVVMQYTGLKDKNSKEIYEGDIIRYENYSYDPSNGDLPYDFSAVKWESFSWCFAEGNIEELEGEDVEVIGNIYENPDLLK